MAQKEYLKMADVFNGESADELFSIAYDGSLSDLGAKYAAHAINSHDELVAEVERLRGLLSEVFPYVKDVEAWGRQYESDLVKKVQLEIK